MVDPIAWHIFYALYIWLETDRLFIVHAADSNNRTDRSDQKKEYFEKWKTEKTGAFDSIYSSGYATLWFFK